MEICPKCKKYTLTLVIKDRVARCYNYDCDFEEKIVDNNDYFNKFVISELNWENYCGQTPREFRVVKPPKGYKGKSKREVF